MTNIVRAQPHLVPTHPPVYPVYSVRQVHQPAPSYPIPQEVAGVLAQLQQLDPNLDPRLARGIGHQQDYAYIDPRTGQQVQGRVATQAWMVPMQVPTPSLPPPPVHPQQPQSPPSTQIFTLQQVGWMLAGLGLVLALLAALLTLTHAQGYSDGLERGVGTPTRQY